MDVGVAPAFACRPVSNLSQRLHQWRIVRILVVPFERFGHHERPPKALPFMGVPCSKSASADAVEIPAC